MNEDSPPFCSLPRDDYWSTPFAETLLEALEIRPGLAILDIACGEGIPAFYLAEQVGPAGQVLGIDMNPHQIARAQARQGSHMPWLRFQCEDMRSLSDQVSTYDRITGNLSIMFFRPHRFEALKKLLRHLKPGGQVVLTFPSLGTFDSLWRRIDVEMAKHGLARARQRLAAYVSERPSAHDGGEWLERLGMERIVVFERPLQVATGSGHRFLDHPLLRGGFLEDVYECFDDPEMADTVMGSVANDLQSFIPLIAQRCALSGWKKEP